VTLERINPPDLATPQTYTHVVVATGTRLVFVAGQVAEDAHDKVVGPGDLAVQARQAFDNVGRALAAAGARPDQVAKITIFVVDLKGRAPAGDRGGPGRAVRGSQTGRHTGGGGDAGTSRLPDRGRGDRGRRRAASDVTGDCSPAIGSVERDDRIDLHELARVPEPAHTEQRAGRHRVAGDPGRAQL